MDWLANWSLGQTHGTHIIMTHMVDLSLSDLSRIIFDDFSGASIPRVVFLCLLVFFPFICLGF